jgi:transposase InsO family protein
VAESIIGLYKNELIHLRGPRKTVEDVELATLSWVHWWNNKRLLAPIGSIPPVEFEQQWLDQRKVSQTHNDQRLPVLVS